MAALGCAGDSRLLGRIQTVILLGSTHASGREALTAAETQILILTTAAVHRISRGMVRITKCRETLAAKSSDKARNVPRRRLRLELDLVTG
jgi:hypothetical protein